MEWKELLDEVRKKGFENASPIARLAWSCETMNGIDQHASPDIQAIADELSALRLALDEARKVINGLLPDVEKAARKLGYHPIDFDNYNAASAWLEKYGNK